MAICEKCGREMDRVCVYDEYKSLCWTCMKKMQMRDERDWKEYPESDKKARNEQ